VPTNLDSATILRNYMVGSLTPVSTFRMLSRLSRVDIVVDRLMDLYPDDPSLGSPYGTGPQTFGFGAAFKRGAAILGDAAFHSLRRAFNRAAAKKGVRSWGYLFSEQSGEPSARGGGSHSALVAIL
jgi:acetylcholinesterase